MKQKFTYLLSLMLMCILGVSNVVAETAVFSASTMTGQASGTAGSTVANNIWYGNGTDLAAGFTIQITSNLGKAYTAQDPSNGNFSQGKSFKNSNGAQNTITLPTGYTATSVKFYVTANADDDAKLSEINGTSCNDAVTSHKDGTNPTVITKSFADPVNTFTFTFSTKQVMFVAEVTYTAPTNDPPSFTTDLQSSYDVTVGRSVTLSVSAKGATSYQWYSNVSNSSTGGTAISGATTDSYTYAPEVAGTSYFYCVVTNANGSKTSTVAAVTAGEWKPITTKRNWLFTQQSKYAADQAAATDLWGGYSSSNKRYANARALAEEELSGNDGPLFGLAGIYFTAPSGKLLLGGKDDNSRSMQTNGNGISMTIPQCNVKDRITLRWSASGSDKNVTITYGNQTISCNGINRNNTGTLIADAAGDVTIGIPNSVRLFEVTVTPYFAVTDFELSTDEVSVEEYENVSVSAKNFTPANYTDGTMEWTTSDAAVATVNNGVITGVKAGTATITATSVDGPSKTVEVTVTPCAPKNLSIEMTSNSDATAPKVESGKNYTLTAKVQGYGLTYQWASKATEKGSYANINGATAQTYEATAVELGSKFYKVTITNAQGSAVAEYEVKTVVPLEAFTIANEDGTGGVNYKALDSDDPEVRIVYQIARADEPVELEIADSVEYAGVTYAVTVVGEEAFVNDMTVVGLETSPVLREIGARAFMACVNLADVELAEGLEIIGDAAFAGCTKLPVIFIPSTVQYVGFKAFADCTSLTDIFYDGTKAEWNALPNIGMAGIAKSVTIHFNDGETENGKGNIVGINNANADEAQKNGKFFENGELVIYKNGKAFTAAGAEKK
ncbi:MAG: leucine-rich repeat protein [Prevotella sp.]|nr:leucine-rich repeat protein [Prevotella sp.]